MYKQEEIIVASIDSLYFERLSSVAVVNPQKVYVIKERDLSCLGVIDNVSTFQRYARVIKTHGFDAQRSTIFISDTAYIAGEDFGELEAFLEVLPNMTFRRWDMNGRLLD